MNERKNYIYQLMLGSELLQSIPIELQSDLEVKEYIIQLQGIIGKGYYHNVINELKLSINELQRIIDSKSLLSLGKGNSLVKKGPGADIYSGVDLGENKPNTAISFPLYIASNVVPISKQQDRRAGNFHILTLALLSFIFEVIFLVLTFILFK